MHSKTTSKFNPVQSVSFPRSGHHLLERTLSAYFSTRIYCDYYECCRSIPCARDYPFRKNHDMEGTLPNDASGTYVIQLRRNPQAQFLAYFRFFRQLYAEGDREFEVQKYFDYFIGYYDKYFRVFLEEPGNSESHQDSYSRFVADHLEYYREFVEKWLLSNANANTYLLFYEDLLSHPEDHVSNVIRLLRDDHRIDKAHLSNVLAEESIALKHDLTESPFYDPSFNEYHNLPELHHFRSGPLFSLPAEKNPVAGKLQRRLKPFGTQAVLPTRTKTAVFILNYNFPEATDRLHDLLSPYQGKDHDLYVLDNGSSTWGIAESTTHRLEKNIFWGGALNWAFRFVLSKIQYDSLLFLNNDISLNPASFVSRLRRELFNGNFQLISPCLAGPAQPWPQMQCWYTGATRTVKWIDMQAPLFHRMLIERVSQFNSSLDYGWGQELVCARICEKNSWSTGVADHICIEHQGMATLKQISGWKAGKEINTPVSLEDYHNKARSNYEKLVNSDPVFYEPLVQWGWDYDGLRDHKPDKVAPQRPNRTDIINSLINRFDFKTYLEIGVADGKNYNKVEAAAKVGVDPNSAMEIANKISSDSFFASLDPETEFDLIFVDGLHEEKQVLRDIHNSLKHLARGGFIVVHDCNPLVEAQQLPGPCLQEWCGTVWKAWARLRCTRRDLEMFVIDSDWGVGVIRRGNQELFQGEIEQFDWRFFDSSRDSLLNLISPETFFNSLAASDSAVSNLVLPDYTRKTNPV